MKQALLLALVAALGVLGTIGAHSASADPWPPFCGKEGCPFPPMPTPTPTPTPTGNPFAGCAWVFSTTNESATASCPSGSFVISGGCDTDQGSFRRGLPTGVSNGSSITAGTGWNCITTANQPITAAALCCPGSR